MRSSWVRSDLHVSEFITEEACYLSSWGLLLKSRWMHTWMTWHVLAINTLRIFTIWEPCAPTHMITPAAWSVRRSDKWQGQTAAESKFPWTIFTSLHHKNLCTHFSFCLLPLLLSLFSRSLAPSVSCFLASSGSRKQESSPNDGIKRVRKMTEKEKEKECGRQLFAPQHPQIQSSEKRKRQLETMFL